MKKAVIAALFVLSAAWVVFAQMWQEPEPGAGVNATEGAAADDKTTEAPAADTAASPESGALPPSSMVSPAMSDEYRTLLFGATALGLQRENEEAERARQTAELAARKPAEAVNATVKAPAPAPVPASEPIAAKPAVNEWDFGKAKSGEVLEHEFLLTNTGGRSLAIKEIHTSCGCTTAEVDRKILDRGETAAVKVRVNTKGEIGELRQSVYVNSDDADNPVRVFKVTANIVK